MAETESKGKNVNRFVDRPLSVPTVSRERNTGQGGKNVIDRAVMNAGCLLTGEKKSVMVQKVNGSKKQNHGLTPVGAGAERVMNGCGETANQRETPETVERIRRKISRFGFSWRLSC